MTEENIQNQEVSPIPSQQQGQENVTAAENLTFDEILKIKGYQSEFDKRVSKSLATAELKWKAKAEEDKNKAVADATSAMTAELTRAMIATELVKSKARDVDVIMPLIDTAKVTLTDKGLEGLEEQIAAIKEGKAYLFETESAPFEMIKGKTGLDHDKHNNGDDDAKIKRILGLPT